MRDLPVGLRWHIGDIEVTSIVEQDLWWKLEKFLPGATNDVVADMPWLSPYLDEDPERFPLRIQAFVVDTGAATILVDTCVGNEKPRDFRDFDNLSTTFLDDLEAAGYVPDGIDFVLCTHLHVDHVGWNTHLVDGRWIPTFPNARYLFGQLEYDHWNADTDAAAAAVMADSVSPIIDAGLADLVESDHHVVDGVDLIPTIGHTPGHVSVRLTSLGQSGVIIGDMAHHPIQLGKPTICSTADIDRSVAIETRWSCFDQWCNEGLLVIGTHFAPPTAGRLVADGEAWRLDPS